jgi:predicted O-methyltransferase YrrM
MPLNIEFIFPTELENNVLNQLDDSYIKISEISKGEREFLNALILRHKPKKILELGVSSGGSSIVILNAIKDFSGTNLYSIDLKDYWYRTGKV